MRRTPLVTFLGLGLILLFSRFWMARSLAAPMWGDAVQHGVIAQLILDNQGLFSSWQPFAEYQTLSIHFGVSALSAGLVWLSGIETVRAVLWIGQIVNVLAVLGLYPLALSLWDGDAWAGTLSVSNRRFCEQCASHLFELGPLRPVERAGGSNGCTLAGAG